MALGIAGLLPMFIGPLWRVLAPQTVPPQLDHLWLLYIALVASFMAGTFWGFALPAIEGTEGQIGVFTASILMLLTWGAMALPYGPSLYAIIGVFLLLLLADFWRERTLGSVIGYFALRTVLTLGAVAAIGWRLAQY
jgi:hypothetical protein